MPGSWYSLITFGTFKIHHSSISIITYFSDYLSSWLHTSLRGIRKFSIFYPFFLSQSVHLICGHPFIEILHVPKRHAFRKQAYSTIRLYQWSIYSAQRIDTTVHGCPRKLIFQPFSIQVTPRVAICVSWSQSTKPHGRKQRSPNNIPQWTYWQECWKATQPGLLPHEREVISIMFLSWA